MGLFGHRHFLDADDDAWHIETWLWLLRNHGGIARLKARKLVRASREFFPPTEAKGHDRALHVFECVKTLTGLSDWPCVLEAQPERPKSQVAELGLLKPIKGSLPLGTYGPIGNEIVITYDPALVDDPGRLVGTLAHELAHYLIDATPGMPPGGKDMREYATDLTVAFLGFGLFGANLAFSFSQHRDVYTQGWQTRSTGYLRERDWAFALAVFCALRDEAVEPLKPLLKPHLYSEARAAQKFLARNSSLLAEHRTL
jgi:hypothetical protein